MDYQVPDETPIPDRRKEDNPSPSTKVWDRGLAITALCFFIAFLWQMVEVLTKHTCWCDFAQPPGVGEILGALVYGLVAIAASMGLNVDSLIKGFKK